METNREELSRIKDVLKKNPRGMNVIEIARAIDMHRQSVTKYLEMLVISGHVEVKAFGPSKVYYLSQRLPLSAMLSLSSDMILLLDRDLNIINVNDAFLAFLDARREEVLNKEMRLISLSLAFNPPIEPFITDALNGNESKIEAHFKKKSRELYFNIKFIPVVFDDGRPGATVLFENITEQKKAAQENERLFRRLKESEQRFRTLIQDLKSGVVLAEADGKFSIYNPAFLQMFALTKEEMETMSITSEKWNAIEVFDGDGNALAHEERPSIKAFATGQPVKDMLIGFRNGAAGGILWVMVNVAVRKSEGGRVDKLICTYYDITDRKLREEQIARLTRLYVTLSRVNEAIVRIHDEGLLFSEVCQIVMEESGYPLVWIGQVRGDQVVPVAGCGRAADYLKEIRVEVQGELGMGPTGTCIRESRAVVNDDFLHNPRTLPWQESALRHGFRASAAFPVYRKGRVFGAFTLYATDPNAFDAEQVRLLQSLSSDISNALGALDNEHSRAKAEQSLRENEERLRRSQAIAHLGSWELDLASNRLTWSDEVYRIFGLQPQEFAATYAAFLEAVHPDDRAAVDAAYSGSLREGRNTYEIEHRVVRRSSGEVRVVHEKCEHFRDAAGNVIRSVGMVHDITERKRLEEALRDSERQLKARLSAILSPGDVSGKTISEIVDIPSLQALADSFYAMTGVGISIIDLKGAVLVGAGWQEICTRFHRCHPEASKNCLESDLHLSGSVEPGKYAMYKCGNGMWDVVTPIVVNGVHTANLVAGQFFFEDEVPDYDYFRQQADKYGFDRADYLAALERTPRHSREKIRIVMDFYTRFAGMISQLSYSNFQLARLIIGERAAEEALLEKNKALAVQAEEIETQNEELRVNYERLAAATRSLQEGEEKLNVLFDMLPVGISVLDNSRNVIRTNPAMNRILGMDEAGFKRRAYDRRTYLKPDGSKIRLDDLPSVRTLHEGKPVLNAVVGVVKEDGTTVWTEVSAVPLPYSDWKLVIATADITEKKHAEEAIRRQASLIDLSPDAIMIRQPGDTITYWSPGAVALYGYTPEEAIGKVSHALLKTRFPQPLEEIDRQLMETGRWTGELVHQAKGGHKVIVQSRWLARQDAPGSPIEIMESNIDITGRKRAEGELAKAKVQAGLYLDLLSHDISRTNMIALGHLELARQIIAERGRLERDDIGLIETAIESITQTKKSIDNARKLQ